MIILGIETTCDETGAAVLEQKKDKIIILSNVVASSADIQAKYGGIVPEIAARKQLECIVPVIESTLKKGNVKPAQLDAIAVTVGPGLIGSLIVGVESAKALSLAWHKPVVPVNHLVAHIYANFIGGGVIEFPFVALLVSGGHTQLMQVDGVGRYQILGETIDDAAGEAFDKSAKLLGLGYPGGPALSKLAEIGDPVAFKLPRPLLHSDNLDFSFAGLKTAVMVQAKKLAMAQGCAVEALPNAVLADLAASTQAAIVEVLVKKSLAAIKGTGLSRLVVAGGVGANRSLREQLNRACAHRGVRVHYPELHLCTDNGAMIAMAAAMRLQSGMQTANEVYAFDVKPRWPLDEIMV